MARYLQFSTVFFVVLVAFSALILESYFAPKNLTLGYLLLFSSDREAQLNYWKKNVKFDTDIIHPPIPVPEILAKDFSYEAMRRATNNFRIPAVVRGLFNGTTATEKWHNEDYLPSKLGQFTIPIVRNAVVGTLQDHRELVNFGDAYREMYNKEYSKEYLFFPVRSRFTFNGSAEGRAEDLQEAVDELCRIDLDYDRLWKGFGTKSHTSFQFAQFVIGKSTNDFTNKSTGSDWHCAGGNNWFIQVHGKKYWEFIEPQYSPYLYPLKGGFFNMWTANKDIANLQKHIPRRYVVLEKGDMVYNPDWQWHKITNYGGLSIGVPVREINLTLTIQNNKLFTAVVLTNKILTQFGLQLGGYPPPSAGTEADN